MSCSVFHQDDQARNRTLLAGGIENVREFFNSEASILLKAKGFSEGKKRRKDYFVSFQRKRWLDERTINGRPPPYEFYLSLLVDHEPFLPIRLVHSITFYSFNSNHNK